MAQPTNYYQGQQLPPINYQGQQPIVQQLYASNQANQRLSQNNLQPLQVPSGVQNSSSFSSAYVPSNNPIIQSTPQVQPATFSPPQYAPPPYQPYQYPPSEASHGSSSGVPYYTPPLPSKQ